MCDYSLLHAKSRPAKMGDKLRTKQFGLTTGFAAPECNATAVCLLPGTEVVFDRAPELEVVIDDTFRIVTIPETRARFRQVNKDLPNRHHDALEFANGETVMLTTLLANQGATVLQLPAPPRNAEEAKEQERLAVVA